MLFVYFKKNSSENLNYEGLKDNCWLTGDIMVVTLKYFLSKVDNRSTLLKNLYLKDKKYYLLTLHRPYNVDNPVILKNILSSLSKLKDDVIFPIHSRTLKNIGIFNIKPHFNIKIINPVGYLDFLILQKYAKKILTDSGRIQKEAYVLGVPCVTLRSETEWLETVEEGWNLLIEPSEKDISDKIIKFQPQKRRKNIFGVNVTQKMIDIINTF